MQVGPGHVLHRDVALPFGCLLSNVVNGDDVWMAELTRDTRFVEESPEEFLFFARPEREGECQHLQGDCPANARIVCLVDHPHRAATELRLDLVPSNGLGDGHRPTSPAVMS